MKAYPFENVLKSWQDSLPGRRCSDVISDGMGSQGFDLTGDDLNKRSQPGMMVFD
jgi:hypothetical protein